MSGTSPQVSMRHIYKSFSRIPALDDASLEIAQSEVHALIGQNGAGKSTLIKVLTGAYQADSGEIEFEGRPIRCTSTQDAQRIGISPIYQEVNLIPYRSVAENIFLGREPRRFGFIDWRTMHREAEDLLSRFQLDVDVRRPLNELTIGVQQMVAIARALSMSARLVIMDEPTSSLTDKEVAVLFDAIARLKAAGTAVLFISHRLDELYAVSDRVTVMRDGKTVAVSPMAGISRSELVSAMLGRAFVSGAGSRRSNDRVDRGSAPLLSVENLSSGARVRDVSVSIDKGQIVGMSGLLGSGRTETARIVFGADRPDGGTIRVNGAAQAFATPTGAIEAGFGFCSEDRKHEGIIADMSVRENLTLALLPQLSKWGIVDTARQTRVVDEFIRRLGIKVAHADQPIRDLSGGNQQKVLLARWLCMTPALLILDEPTRGIDVGAKAEIQKLVKDFAERGLGVLMISSEIEELLEACDEIVVLREGRDVAHLGRDGMNEQAIMRAMAQDDETPDTGVQHGH